MPPLLNQWLTCLVQYVRLSLFRSSPASLPYSLNCILLTFLAYLAARILLLHQLQSLSLTVAQALLDMFILYAITYAMLRFTNKSERLVKTMSALVGVNLVVSIVDLPVMSLLPDINRDEPIDPLVFYVNLLLLFWYLAIVSLIFKRSFDIRTTTAGFLSFNYFLFELLLLNLLL